jgi:multiple sugar transport system substrate-binding protein
MKKIFSVVLLLVMLLTACTPAATPTAAPAQPTAVPQAPAATAVPQAAAPTAVPPTAAPVQEQVTLKFVIWDSNQQEFSQKSIDLFEKEHPNIKVNMELIGWGDYWQKIKATMAGQESYDTFWMDTYNFTDYASRGAMLDLSPYIAADGLDMDTMYGKGRMVNVNYQGKIFAMPKDSDDPAVYYNKDLFDKYGVAYPAKGWTWDDFKEMAKKLNHPEDGVYGFTTGQFGGGPDWWNWVWQNGGEFLNPEGNKVLLEEPASCDAIKYWYAMMKDGLAPDGNIIMASDPTQVIFPQGKAAMIYYGQWMLGPFAKLPFKLGVAPVPAGPKGNGLQLGGLNYAAWAGTKHPKEAWEFIKFMSGSEAMEIQAQAGIIIPALSSSQATWAKTYPNLDLQGTFLDMMQYGKRPVFVGWDWNNEVNKVLTDVWSGNIPIEQACKAASDAGTAALAKRTQ